MAQKLSIDHLTKIEGHATLALQVEGSTVKKCELSSIEGARYFEGLVKGKHYSEASEITSRICGICSCAHTLAAIMAVENALDVKPSRQTVNLRKLLAIGERIRSHATHLYFLALPDYVGHESVLSMLPKYLPQVKSALKMTRVGNALIRVVGGRDLHPVSATIGGFLKIPSPLQVAGLAKELASIRKDAIATARLFAGFKNPKAGSAGEFFSLYDGRSYPLFYGSIKSGEHSFSQSDYASYLREYHEPYSTANFVVREGKTYCVGALARINNNFEFLSPAARRLAEEAGIAFPNTNPYLNNYSQALELVHYVDEAIGVCKQLSRVSFEPVPKTESIASRGIAAIEVPRGVLWHEYLLDGDGTITFANIVTPTAQNLRKMQEDIRQVLPSLLSLPRKKVVLKVEELIRAYDPCFSCSTHFLKVKWLRK